jgi:hypothetical protein
MTREDRFVRALALTESGDNPEAWGDHGKAFGRWQWHIATLLDWLREHQLEYHAGMTVDELGELAVRSFFRAVLAAAAAARDETIAMCFHLHGRVKFSGWDAPYADRFMACMEQVAREASN